MPTSINCKPFMIYLIQHSHIDIGYTERQEVIAEYQRQFIGQAVRLATAPQQRVRGDNHRFRFTCEGFWAVELFWNRASAEEKLLFLKAVDEGLIEVGGTYLHMSELLDEGHLRETLLPALKFGREINRKITWAGSFDVNGFPWGWSDILIEAGIKYFSTCINTHHGGRPFGQRNVPFFWQSPRGQRILTWDGQTYHRGNLYGMVPGSDSASIPAFPVGDLTLAEAKLLPKIEEFRNQGIAVDYAPVFIGGLYTDNSPPTDLVCDHVAAWNDKHGDTVIVRLATMAEFFARLESESADFPVVSGDWPDWWGDGTISTPLETQVFRNAQRVKREVERLDPAHKVVSLSRLEEIRKQLWLFAEHTWGYSDSVSSPWDFLCHEIVLRKAAYAVRADELAMTAMDDVLYARGQGQFTDRQPFSYKVINTLDQPVEALALLPVDFWETSWLTGGFIVEDSKGKPVPHQVSLFGRGQHVAILVHLGPMEEARFKLRFEALLKAECSDPLSDATFFENDSFRIDWDSVNGPTSLLCKRTGLQLLDESNQGLGRPVYQLFPTPEGKSPSSLRAQAGIHKMKPEAHVSTGILKSVRRTQHGACFSTWQFIYELEGCDQYQVEYLFPTSGSSFHMSARINKNNVWHPEGTYLSFPFGIDGARWKLDRVGAVVQPGRDQLPKTCCDYYMVQRGVLLAGGVTGVSITMRDTPMVQIGALRLWDYSTSIEATGPLYSWQTNNKWETNFKAACGGFYEFRYTVEIGQHLSESEAGIAALDRGSNPPRAIRL